MILKSLLEKILHIDVFLNELCCVFFSGESSTDPNPADEAGEEESADPKTCPIIPGRETTIEIEKGRTGLGLSIVGGADTLLVSGMWSYWWGDYIISSFFSVNSVFNR